MNKKQAIGAMLVGEKVRLNTFQQGEYFTLDDSGYFINELRQSIQINQYPNERWELYNEDRLSLDDVLEKTLGIKPKKSEAEEPKTVTIERWLVCDMEESMYWVMEGTPSYVSSMSPFRVKLVNRLGSYTVEVPNA